MNKLQEKKARLQRRHRRVRGKVSGTPARPRLCVTRSNSNIYAQVKALGISGATVEGAAALGGIISKLAQEKGVTEVVFDRGGNLYHGRVKALAEGAREAGLKF